MEYFEKTDQFLSAFHLAHLILSVFFFYFCFKTRFRFPKYIHFIAFLAFILGMVISTLMSNDAPIILEYGNIGKYSMTIFFPAIVYFTFVFYGGQKEAYDSKMTRIVICSYCGEEMAIRDKNIKILNKSTVSLCKCCGRIFSDLT